ncbi:diguanylate cyclase [Azoarcus sp. L1K30]|uniref:diguanylate cyclase domain-containing protein n=1 Tax=Azoarcus sp. L1K30 TaxID=2820277 RepID=UPI001B816A55|nr:diguanylate cyclase [Azoarcus sp. L1K30]MBR0565672.1 diguanylate cyclase [Azoarcus sp. L1K30]
MNKLSLRQRLLMVGLLPAALLAACITSLVLWRGTSAMDAALNDRGVAIVSFLAPAAEYAVISGNRDTQMSLLQAVLEQADVTGAALYDRDGGLLAVSGRLRLVHAGQVVGSDRPQIIARGESRLGYAAPVVSAPLIIDDVFDPQSRAGRRDRTETIGWVYVELSDDALLARKNNIILLAIGVFVAGLGVAGFIASRLASAVGKPLASLVDAVRRIGEGELDVSVADDAPSDELRHLQRGFNSMARSISVSHQEMQHRIDEATSKLAFQALHDPLTGLPNRRAFEQTLESAVERSRRSGDHATLCFIDLDRFKIVNDSCGHAAGDELLQEIAQMIKSRIRSGDLISRIGGDEFALVLHDCTPEDARRLAESLREAVSSLRFDWNGRSFTVGASIGLVRIDGRNNSASDLLVAADLACYAAKKSGRNRVEEHTVDATGGIRRHTDLPQPKNAAALTLPYDELVLFHQHIRPIAGELQFEWVEILLRQRDASGVPGSAQPLLFSLSMDERGLELDLWIARHAFQSLGAANPATQISLNLSAFTVLHAERYWPLLHEYLGTTGTAAERIVLEFPARLAEQWPSECGRFVDVARKSGVRIALEKLDGSSTTLLPTLRPDIVKVSLKSLVESFGLEAGCNLAQALCGMANALAIPVVASEVEDPLLRDLLGNYGFTYIQGNLVSEALALAKDSADHIFNGSA